MKKVGRPVVKIPLDKKLTVRLTSVEYGLYKDAVKSMAEHCRSMIRNYLLYQK